MSRPTLDPTQVIDEAARLADTEGLDALTLTRVADALGVQQPALYRHVDGYDDLIRSLGLRGRELLAERLSEAAQGVAGEDAVRSLGDAWRSVVRDAPGLYAATDRYPCAGDDELEAAVERVVNVIARSLAGFDLDDAHRDGDDGEVRLARERRDVGAVDVWILLSEPAHERVVQSRRVAPEEAGAKRARE